MGKNQPENKINELRHKKDELEQKNQELEREWIRKQTVLVTQTNKYNLLDGETSALKTQQTILEQKKMRLNNQY